MKYLFLVLFLFFSCSPRQTIVVDITWCEGRADTVTYPVHKMTVAETQVMFMTVERQNGDTIFTRDTCK